jgi:hypothetical protein
MKEAFKDVFPSMKQSRQENSKKDVKVINKFDNFKKTHKMANCIIKY